MSKKRIVILTEEQLNELSMDSVIMTGYDSAEPEGKIDCQVSADLPSRDKSTNITTDKADNIGRGSIPSWRRNTVKVFSKV